MADIRSAYFQSPTSQKHYIICGPEFGMENVGKVAIMHRAVYGGKTSGRDFRNHLRSCMEFINFTSCPADPDVWMRPDMIYIKTQVFRLLRYYSPAPRNIARSDWATQNNTHNMTSSIIQPYGLLSP